jgi:hypothetical protein
LFVVKFSNVNSVISKGCGPGDDLKNCAILVCISLSLSSIICSMRV